MEEWLIQKVHDTRDFITAPIRAILSFGSSFIWGVYWHIRDWEVTHKSHIDKTRDWFPLPWLLYWLEIVLDGIMWVLTTSAEEAIRFYFSIYDVDFGDWTINREIWEAFLVIEEWAGAIGKWIDDAWIEIDKIAWMIIQSALDPVGWALGEVHRLVTGGDYNAWDWCKAFNTTVWDAIICICTWLGNALWAALKKVPKGIEALINIILDPVGFAVCEVQRRFANSDYNAWGWLKASNPNNWEALKAAFLFLADTVWDWILKLPKTLLNLIGFVFDPLGWGICEIQRRVANSDYNAWPWIKSTSPSSWEACRKALEFLGDTLWDRLPILDINRVDEWLLGLLQRLVDRFAQRLLKMAELVLEKVW